jgi:hypothetical protein
VQSIRITQEVTMWMLSSPFRRAYLFWRFRVLVYKAVAISALALIGFDLLRMGWLEFGILNLSIVATYDDISITGGYADIGLGLLLLYWAWLLARRWFVGGSGALLRHPHAFTAPWPWTKPL